MALRTTLHCTELEHHNSRTGGHINSNVHGLAAKKVIKSFCSCAIFTKFFENDKIISVSFILTIHQSYTHNTLYKAKKYLWLYYYIYFKLHRTDDVLRNGVSTKRQLKLHTKKMTGRLKQQKKTSVKRTYSVLFFVLASFFLSSMNDSGKKNTVPYNKSIIYKSKEIARI